MKTIAGALGAMGVLAAAGTAGATVTIDIFQSGADIDVTASGSLDLTGATFDHSQAYSTGIIPGGSNFYVALGTTPGMDWYQLIHTEVYGTSGTYFTSSTTSGDAISIWGESGIQSLVGVPTGYVSGTLLSATMTLAGETISGMSLIPGTYVFRIPNDDIILDITGSVPEAGTWALLLVGFGAVGAALRGSRRKTIAAL